MRKARPTSAKSPTKPTTATGKPQAHDNRVRIIAGTWRGRKLPFPSSEGLRPTGDRIRETLFNWLAPYLPNARVLDMFAGSGALGFEALSRGAAHCLMLEKTPAVAQSLQQNAQTLGANNLQLHAGCAEAWLTQAASEPFDVVFIDPPFAVQTLNQSTLAAQLAARGLLNDGALIYVEQARDTPLALPAGFSLHRSLNAGQVTCALWRYQQLA